jgi:hypothetical protein
VHVVLISHGRLGIKRKTLRHVAAGHVWVLRHARATCLGWEVLVCRLLGRFNLVTSIHAVLVTRSGLWSIQTSLEDNQYADFNAG